VAAAGLRWRALFAAGSLGAALGGFATALVLAVGLGLALLAVRLTGGLASELLGRQIESNIVAEGIEHPDEFRSLLKLGVNYGQGYLLGRPSPQVSH
jgi:hypothetical protein